MNSLKLTLSYLKLKKLNSLLIVIMLAIGFTSISLILDISRSFNEKLMRDAKAVDLVVGAKGSPLQLVLSTVYHSDIPTGNISNEDAQKIAKHREVKDSLMLGLGDNFKNYRIVGTEAKFTDFYKVTLNEGVNFTQPFQAVIGNEVALKSGLKIGDSFYGSHGFAASGNGHEEFPYTVVGILKPSGNITDKLIFADIESVWQVHSNHHNHDNHHNHVEGEHHTNNDVTAVLLKLKSPMSGFNLPRIINRQSNLLAANPSFEAARLFKLMNYGTDILKLFSGFMIAASLLMMGISLYSSLKQRNFDYAVIRVLGGSRFFISLNILLETMLLTTAGLIIGIVLTFGFVKILPVAYSQLSGLQLYDNLFVIEQAVLLFSILSIAILVAIIPAIQAYKIQITKNLNS